MITVHKAAATDRIGVRAVAINDRTGAREFEMWDYNAPEFENYRRAARKVAHGAVTWVDADSFSTGVGVSHYFEEIVAPTFNSANNCNCEGS